MLIPPTVTSSGTQSPRAWRWKPPEYAFHAPAPERPHGAKLSELEAGLSPHETATRCRQPSGTETRTAEVPARIAIPALR